MTDEPRCLRELEKEGQMELEKLVSEANAYGYCPTCKQPAVQCDKGTGIAKCSLGHTWQAIEPGPIPDELDSNKPVPSILPRPDSPWTNPFVSMTSDKGVIKEHNGHHHLHVSGGGMDGEMIVGAEGIERYADGERVSVQLIISKIKPSEWTH